MSVSSEEILEAVSNMSVMEVVDLVKAMEDKFGVKAATAVAVAPTGDGEGESKAVVEQTEFDVVLTSFGSSKVPVIKTVRAITGLGLKEAKNLVESAPVPIKEAITKEESEAMKKQLEEVGGSVEIK